MTASKTFIIGAGRIGQLLLKILPRELSLTIIDIDHDSLTQAEEIHGAFTTTVNGDATSRLILEKSGIQNANTVVVTTTTESINLEVVRILREHFNIGRIISIGISQEGIAELERLGAEVESIFSDIAAGLRNRLEQRARTVHGIGLGNNEILEVEVHPNSRLIHKSLSRLNPRRWKIGLIYRDGKIIIPSGDTMLRAKDRVIILGEPSVLSTVSELLSFRFEHFPLEYGNTTIVYVEDSLTEKYLEEVDYIFSIFPLRRAVFVCPVNKETELKQGLVEFTRQHGLEEIAIEVTDLPPLEAVGKVLKNSLWRAGLIVLPKSGLLDSVNPFSLQIKRKRFLLGLARTGRCPILLARGTHPYVKTGIPCVGIDGLQEGIETTLEISAMVNFSIDTIFARISKYIITAEETSEYELMKTIIAETGFMYSSSIGSVELGGNPVREITRELIKYRLMVANMNSWKNTGLLDSFFRPDTIWQIVRHSAISTLLLPPVETGT